MTTVQTAGAVSGAAAEWLAIDWQSVNRNVRRLQVRIVQAWKAGRWNKVKALQHLLTCSYSGKVLAVRRVTENAGKKTSGVDGEIWDTPEKKAQAVHVLKRNGYRAQPLRRVYIPKKSDSKTMRPLGIPTMKDRAMQALHLLALAPVVKPLRIQTRMGFVSNGPAPMRFDSVILHCEAQTRSGFWRETSKPVLTRLAKTGF
jgi:RNA-directed DNA polymerase